MKHRSLAILVLALAIVAASVIYIRAQNPTWKVVFTASTDHSVVAHGADLVQKYELVATRNGAPAALPPFDLGKPAPTAGVITVNINAYALSLPEGTYTAVVRAVGPGGNGTSVVSDPFVFTVPAPGSAGKPGVSKS